MGNSLCCTQQDGSEIIDGVIPIHSRRKGVRSTSKRRDTREYVDRRLNSQAYERRTIQTKMNYPSDGPSIAFELSYHFPIQYMSFSQRRFLGFRNRYEFDKKRVVFGSNREYVVVGFDYEKRVYELFRAFVSFDEEIRFISFLEDHVPSFLFIITWNKREQKTFIRILKLKKNDRFDEQLRVEETKREVAEQILENIQKGNFAKKRKKSYDNLELVPNKQLLINNTNTKNEYVQKNYEANRFSTTERWKPASVNRQHTFTHSGFSSIINGVLNTNHDNGGGTTPVNRHSMNSLTKSNDELYMSFKNYNEVNAGRSPAEFEEQNDKDTNLTEECLNPFQQASAKKNTISDYLVTEYPFITEEFGKLQIADKILKAFLFNGHNATYIFTIEENKIVSIYLIKSYMNSQFLNQQNYYLKQTMKISNFRMAKRAALELEFYPRQIEFFGDYFILIYKNNKNVPEGAQNFNPNQSIIPFVDIFERTGKPLSRMDVKQILLTHGLQLQKIHSVKFMRLQWSGRRVDEYDMNKASVLKNAVICGRCVYKERIKPFLMKVNLETQKAEIIKILNLDDKITIMNFGPYDNGYILIGMESGALLSFDSFSLDKLQHIPLFTTPIKSINFEPTNLIFVGSTQGEILALSVLNKELHYVYLDLGKRQYCTVALPKTQGIEVGGRDSSNPRQYLDERQSFCCL